jgi:hypothetical protein
LVFLFFLKKNIAFKELKLMFIKYKKIFYQIFKNLFFILLLFFFPIVTFLETNENIDFYSIIFDDETSFFSKEALSYHQKYLIGIIISLFCISSGFFFYYNDPYNISIVALQKDVLSYQNIDQLFFLLENQLEKKEFFGLLSVLSKLDVITGYKYFAINYINIMLTNSYSQDFSRDPDYVRKILVSLIIEIESQYY